MNKHKDTKKNKLIDEAAKKWANLLITHIQSKNYSSSNKKGKATYAK